MSLPGQLYMLQQIDLELQRKREELNEIENQLNDDKALVSAESEFAWQKEQLADAKKRQKNTEWELDDLQEKINKLNRKLYDGATKNPKELVNLENELKSLRSRISGQEDELLGLMSQVEEMEAKVKTNTEELKHLKQEWQQKQETLKLRKTEIEAELVELSQARDELVQQITLEALGLYEQIRLTKEQAIAKVVQGRCQGCHITLPTSQWQKARAGDLIQCNSCNRILYLE
jgi:predicted  nucleic acid-binding Zn-ribbon protein